MMKKPEIVNELVLHSEDYQVWLSFNADQDAEDFEEWWNTVGEGHFFAWVKLQWKNAREQ